MKKWILLFSLFSTLTSWGQYTYGYTDPCTLVSKSIFVPATGGVAVNYFGNVNTFTSNDFQSGAFETWIEQIAQLNSSSPCEQITTTVVNAINNITVANTLTVVSNVVSVTNVAQSIATVGGSVGSSMTGTAGGVTNSSQSEGGSTNQNSKDDKKPNSNTSTGANTGTTGSSSTSNPSQTSQTPSSTSGGTSTEPTSGTPQQGGESGNTNQSTQNGNTTSESSVEGSSGSGNNLANSLSNSVDGGSADGGSTSGGGGGASGGNKKSNAATKNVGSLIASGDVVAIANTDQTQNFRFVGSITHANTRGTRIKGVLFNYTSGVNNLNVTFYKSWINKSRSLNTVGAQSFMMDFDKNFFSTTTVLESYKVNNKLTAMFGLNFTAGKMGERSLLNLSAVGGAHTNFKVTNRVSTSLLVLGVYSPFTQFYEGKWWDAGILAVPFNSWDLKITKTFKFNVSFTGVYQVGESFLNYQILTGGKLNF